MDKERINIKDLSEMYGLTSNFFRTILCRPEFTKYMTSRNMFKNCYGFLFEVENVIKLKMQSTRSPLRFLTIPSHI